MSVESNWWEHFFEGLSVKLWLEALSPEHTYSEADTIARLLLRTAPGAELLDVPCAVRVRSHEEGSRLSLRSRLIRSGMLRRTTRPRN